MPNYPKKTTPSSLVKKMPKEGSKKFVGPRRQGGLTAQEVLEVDPETYRFYTPKQRPKVGTIKNRMPSSTTRPFTLGFAPEPSAKRMARNAGARRNLPTYPSGGLTYQEVKAAVDKLNPKLRAKLRDSLAEGLRANRPSSDIPF